MANSTKSVQINFRAPEEYKTEWDKWQALAKQEGVEFRDWLFPRIRQSLAPKPTKTVSASNTVAAYRKGYYVGTLVGRLDWVFEEGQEQDIDRGALKAWCARHPDCVPDVLSILTAKPYGIRFHAWWQGIMSDASVAAAHIPSAHP